MTFFAAHQRRAVPTGIVAGLAWAGVQLFRLRYAARSIGESRGTLPVLHDWFILLGVLAVGHAAAGARLRAPLCLAALLPALVLTLLCRKAVHRHLASVRRRAQAVIKVLVVGEAAAADGVTAHLAARTDHPYVAVGAVPVGPGPFASGIRTGERLAAAQPEAPGEDANLVISAVHRLGADLVLVVPGAATSGERLRRLSWGLHDAGIELFVAPGLVEVSVKRLETGSMRRDVTAAGGAAGTGGHAAAAQGDPRPQHRPAGPARAGAGAAGGRDRGETVLAGAGALPP